MTDSLWQWLKLKVVLKLIDLYVVPRTKLSVLVARLLGRKHPTVQHAVSNTTVQWLARHLSISQFHTATTSAADPLLVLNLYPRLKELGATIEHIQSSTFRAVYMPKYLSAPCLILHVHGGGFVSGSPESSADYLLQLSLQLQARGITADILSLGYSLAPEATYPHALGEIVDGYLYAVSQNKPIVLLGDSAGATQCLGLLKHLSCPHDSLSKPPEGAKDRIVAVCLASPWVNLKNDNESPQLVDGVDCLDTHALNCWRDAYLDGQHLDEYNNPIMNQTGWKECLPAKTLLMTGELDSFSADIMALSNIMKQDGAQGVETYVAPLRGHSWNLVDFGLARSGTQTKMASQDIQHAYEGVLLQSRIDYLKNLLDHCESFPTSFQAVREIHHAVSDF